MKKLLVTILISAVLLLCACSQNADTIDINDRLEQLDELNESELTPKPNPIKEQALGTFRNIPFGSTASQIEIKETLPVVNIYHDAIDFENTEVFSYSMQPTYWLNYDGLLYRGSYSFRTSRNLFDIIEELQYYLDDIYTNAAQYGFRNQDYKYVQFDDKQQTIDAIENNEIHYYEWYFYDGIDIEVFIEWENGSYLVYLLFTDRKYQ